MRNPEAKKHYNIQCEKFKMLLRNYREKKWNSFLSKKLNDLKIFKTCRSFINRKQFNHPILWQHRLVYRLWGKAEIFVNILISQLTCPKGRYKLEKEVTATIEMLNSTEGENILPI